VERPEGLTSGAPNRPTTLTDYWAIVRRRAWAVALPLIFAPAAAVLFSSMQSPLYSASSSVLINRENIVNLVTGTSPGFDDPERIMQTQANLARSPELIGRVVQASGVPQITVGALLGESSVSARANADVLDFAVKNANPSAAKRLATAYAIQYTKFRIERDTAALSQALDRVRLRVSNLRAKGIDPGSSQFTPLLNLQSQIETAMTLQTSNTSVLQQADSATKVRPRTRRNGILGIFLGGVLGLGLAFLAEALDKRVRSQREIDAAVALPLLGRIPKPNRRLQKADEIVMLTEPRSIAAEPIRKLRTNLEFVNLDRNIRTILFTSSVQREGKSTTVANLAVALARAGRRVALVDLDLRRPYLNRFFRLPPSPGITDVALGRWELSAALSQVPIPAAEAEGVRGNPRSASVRSSPTNGNRRLDAFLALLPAGRMPPDAGEFVGTPAVGQIIHSLSEQFDYVLIDAPPLLAVGDAMTLSASVDAMIVLVRLNVAHRGMLHELARLLDACPAEKLGYVLAGAELGESYGYGYDYEYERREAEPVRRQPVS